MRSLWLIIPAFRRYEVTSISLPQIAWACDMLRSHHDIDGQALVIGDDDNLAVAEANGMQTLERPNSPLGKKWNDGYEYACRQGADYVCPCGTDDWLDPDYLAQLPGPREVRASRASTTVSEDGTRLAKIVVDYAGGDGIRIIPRTMLEGCGFRPTDDHRERAIDTGAWLKLNRTSPGYEFVYSRDPLNIVQFQSHTPQLNTYKMLTARFEHSEHLDVWRVLRSRYPRRFVEAAERMYAERNACA